MTDHTHEASLRFEEPACIFITAERERSLRSRQLGQRSR